MLTTLGVSSDGRPVVGTIRKVPQRRSAYDVRLYGFDGGYITSYYNNVEKGWAAALSRLDGMLALMGVGERITIDNSPPDEGDTDAAPTDQPA